jgi:PAS domain-containing protein
MKSWMASYQHIKSLERYKRVFETTQDGILLLDANTGKILDANPCTSKLSAY